MLYKNSCISVPTKISSIVKLSLCCSVYYIQCIVRFHSTVKTMKVLNVAEKNDAAKNIASHLSRGTAKRREGLSPYNKIYEFNLNLWNQNCNMIMTSVSGHLLNHEFVGAYCKWYSCQPLSLFDAPIMKRCIEESSVKIKKTLEREVQKCSALIIWTDCDREGENIGFEIIEVCQAIKPNVRVYRAKFSEITQASVNRALQNLCEPDKAMNDAVNVRSELDLRIGAAFTRFQTMRLTRVFPRSLADMLISYGSCQFPTLGFVVERFLAIERFKPEPYWKIKVMDVHDNISVEFRWARGKLFEKLPCEVLYDKCREQPVATVQKVTRKPKNKWRPLPLDTVELEKQGSRKLHLSAKETMKIAEKLYTQGFISYPRTETNIFPKELDLLSLVNQQVNNAAWGNFAQQLTCVGLTPRQGKKSDQAHPPIHPLKYTDTLNGNEAKVYEFVVRHFLACLSANAVGQETTVEIDIAGEEFIANGLQIIERNYLEVYVYEKWSDKEIHAYQERQVFTPTSIDIVQEETSPPQLLTEADLIGLMDKYGIGTDATHADHIDTIKSRQYVGLVNGKHLMPGKLGIGLVIGYNNMGFQMSKPDLRSELENDLKLICEQRKSPADVLRNQINKYRDVFKITMERANLIDDALANYLDEHPNAPQDIQAFNPPQEVAIFKCPKCGLNMTLRDRKQGTGKFIGCMGYPMCTNVIWFPQNINAIEVLDEVCSQCSENRRQLQFTFPPNAFPFYGTSYVTCIGGCDPSFNELLNIKNENIKKQTNDSGYRSMFDGTRSLSISSTLPVRNNESRSSSLVGNDVTLSESIASAGPVQNERRNNSNNNASRARNYGPKKRIGTQNDTRVDPSNYSSLSSEIMSNDERTWGNIDNDTVIMCNCHEVAIKLTVRKDGPNQGRTFYKCSKPKGSDCNFFLWASNDMTRTLNDTSTDSNQMLIRNPNPTINRHSSSYNGTSITQSREVRCNCNQRAVQRTVQKEGINKGRLFYCCAKNMTDSCKFFQWADENVNMSNTLFGESSRNTSREREDRRHKNTQKKPRAGGGDKRKCGICRREGHTRKTCPDNAMD